MASQLVVHHLKYYIDFRYTFAISAMLGEAETEKTEGESIISKLDPHQKWTAPSLHTDPSDGSATIEWAHANCM